MISVDYCDTWQNPPTMPTNAVCDGCGVGCLEEDLALVGGPGNYRYLCSDCSAEEDEDFQAAIADAQEFYEDEE